jgi:hypothetical protein
LVVREAVCVLGRSEQVGGAGAKDTRERRFGRLPRLESLCRLGPIPGVNGAAGGSFP